MLWFVFTIAAEFEALAVVAVVLQAAVDVISNFCSFSGWCWNVSVLELEEVLAVIGEAVVVRYFWVASVGANWSLEK